MSSRPVTSSPPSLIHLRLHVQINPFNLVLLSHLKKKASFVDSIHLRFQQTIAIKTHTETYLSNSLGESYVSG